MDGILEKGWFLKEIKSPFIKIAYLLFVSSLSILFDSIYSLFALFCINFFLFLLYPLKREEKRFLFFCLLTLTLGTVVSQSIFYQMEPKTLILSLFRYKAIDIGIYREGIFWGAIQSARFNSVLIVSFVICQTTSPKEMMEVLAWLRIPYVISFLVVTSLRFVPIFLEEAKTVYTMTRLRGENVLHINPFLTISVLLKMIRPVVIGSFKKANEMSQALQSRAFSLKIKRRRKERLKRLEKIIISAFFIFSLLVVLLKFLYWLYLFGFYYNSELRWIYEICWKFL